MPTHLYIYIYILRERERERERKSVCVCAMIKLSQFWMIKFLFLFWRQHPTRHQLYGHLPPITKTIQVRRTRHAGHCWRSRDELIRDVLLWTPTHGRAKAGRTYIQQLCEDTGCCPEHLPRAMNDREEWRERVRDIRATSAMMMMMMMTFLFTLYLFPVFSFFHTVNQRHLGIVL